MEVIGPRVTFVLLFGGVTTTGQNKYPRFTTLIYNSFEKNQSFSDFNLGITPPFFSVRVYNYMHAKKSISIAPIFLLYDRFYLRLFSPPSDVSEIESKVTSTCEHLARDL